MYTFSHRSIENLRECDPRLREVAFGVIAIYDFSVVCGARSLDQQENLIREGKTWTLDSAHLIDKKNPFSFAFDILPYPFKQSDWLNREKFCYMAGIFIGVASGMGIKLRWGGDWKDIKDPTLNRRFDGSHFELFNWRSEKCST